MLWIITLRQSHERDGLSKSGRNSIFTQNKLRSFVFYMSFININLVYVLLKPSREILIFIMININYKMRRALSDVALHFPNKRIQYVASTLNAGVKETNTARRKFQEIWAVY